MNRILRSILQFTGSLVKRIFWYSMCIKQSTCTVGKGTWNVSDTTWKFSCTVTSRRIHCKLQERSVHYWYNEPFSSNWHYSVYLTHPCGRAQQLLSVAQWLERRTRITWPQVQVLPEGLSHLLNCSKFDISYDLRVIGSYIAELKYW